MELDPQSDELNGLPTASEAELPSAPDTVSLHEESASLDHMTVDCDDSDPTNIETSAPAAPGDAADSLKEAPQPVKPEAKTHTTRKRKRRVVVAQEAEEDNDDVYEVEAIVGHRRFRNKDQYRIKWKGFSSAQNTWEDRKNLQCAKLLKQFQAQSDQRPEAITGKRKVEGSRRVEFRVQWAGCDPSQSTWHSSCQLTHCAELIQQFEKEAAKQRRAEQLAEQLAEQQESSSEEESEEAPLGEIASCLLSPRGTQACKLTPSRASSDQNQLRHVIQQVAPELDISLDAHQWLTGTLIDQVLLRFAYEYPRFSFLPSSFAAFELGHALRCSKNFLDFRPLDVLGQPVWTVSKKPLLLLHNPGKNHWTFIRILFCGKIELYEPLGSTKRMSRRDLPEGLLEWLQVVSPINELKMKSKDQKGASWLDKSSSMIMSQQQQNSYDCGVASLLYCELIAQGRKSDIPRATQQDITTFRATLQTYISSHQQALPDSQPTAAAEPSSEPYNSEPAQTAD